MQEKLAFEVINEKFNFVENFVDSETFAHITFPQLEQIVKQLLPNKFRSLSTELKAVFD